MKNYIINLFLIIGICFASFPSAAQITEFRSWQDVSYLLGEKATFYGKTRWTSGTISLVSDGEKYWLYIQDVKFLPVHTGELSRNTAGLGVMDGGKPIPFTLHVSSSEKPYITFDSRRTENIFAHGDYGWEYYEPDILNGKPLIRAHTYDKYNGESSRPKAAKFYMVGTENRNNPNGRNNNDNTISKHSYTAADFQGKTFSGSGNEAHIGYDLTISFGNDNYCVCLSENGGDIGWTHKSVEGTYNIEGSKLYVKCPEGNWEFDIQESGKILFFDRSEGQAMPDYMTLEYTPSGTSNVSKAPKKPSIRKNQVGKKLVQQIKEEWIDWTGNRIYNFCHTYNFTYDVDGNLQSVSKSSEDKPHKFIEKLEFVDNDFKFTLMQDGKSVNSHKRQYYWNKSYKRPGVGIKGCLISDHAVEDGFDNYFAKIHYYTDTYTLRMDCIGFDTFNEWVTDIKEGQYNGLWTATDMNPLNHLYLIPNDVFMKFGFKNGMHRYMSSDSIMYLVDGYEMKEFAYMNGNPVDRPQGELSEYREPSKYRIEYSSYDNDTNVNILFLSNSETLNSFYTNVECITEWFPIKSKKLPSYYRRIGNSHDKKWDYKFDNEGNLVEVIMDARGAGGKSTVTYTISYVWE